MQDARESTTTTVLRRKKTLLPTIEIKQIEDNEHVESQNTQNYGNSFSKLQFRFSVTSISNYELEVQEKTSVNSSYPQTATQTKLE